MGKSCGGISRREFVGRAAAGAAAAALPNGLTGCAAGRGRKAPNERLNVGFVGVGDRGSYILGAALECKDVQVVAVCDVKSDRRDAAAALIDERYGSAGCARYGLHEELIARDDIDAVVIATCDHWHVLHAEAALRAGKGVYLEKPMGVSIAEDQHLRATVRRTGGVFQFGTQQRSEDGFRRACELVRSGRIGALEEIRVWAPPSVSGGPTNVVPVPPTLDYERWLGPAPAAPYTEDRASNKWWWYIYDYSLGFITAWGIHPMDIAVWGAGTLFDAPFAIEGTGAYPAEGLCNTATSWDLHYAFDSGVRMHYVSDPPPAEWRARYGGDITGHGTAFEGSEGWVHVDRNRMRASSEAIANAPDPPAGEGLYRSRHHLRDFFDAVRERRDPVAPIEEAVRGDILCQVADHAVRLGRPLRWDTRKEHYPGDAAANALLERPMRAPWRL